MVSDAQNLQIERPHAPKDPPSQEVQEYNIAHMLLRSWCPSCVLGQARDKHRQRRGQCEDGLSEVVFGCCFLGGEGVEETVAIWVATGRRTRKIFAHTAPENGVIREFGANARIEDCEKLGYKETILRRCFAGMRSRRGGTIRRSLQTHQRETVAQME